MKEFKDLIMMINNNTIIKETGINIKCELLDDNIHNWSILFNKSNIPSDHKLFKQLIDFNIEDIELEVLFPERYPISPPFMRIKKPRFKYRTGHITLGGSICMELLTTQGWLPSMTMKKLLLQINMLFIDGEAELDLNKWNVEYSLSEAKTAFSRMIRTHGWN